MKNRQSIIWNNSGFTIVEIIVVIILIMIAIYPMGRIIASALESTEDEQHMTHCAFLAQLKMEETRTRMDCYSSPAASACPGGGPSDFNMNMDQTPPCNFPYPFSRYECKVVTKAIAGTGNRQRYIKVRVWYDKIDDDVFDSAMEPDVYLETRMTKHNPDW